MYDYRYTLVLIGAIVGLAYSHIYLRHRVRGTHEVVPFSVHRLKFHERDATIVIFKRTGQLTKR